MTVPSTARRAGPYTGTGTQTAFPFAFRVFSATDVRVVLASAGVETVLSTGYSVSINADQDATPGGTVNMVVAPTSLQTLAITGGTPFDQTLDLPSGGNYSPRALENALDRIVFQIQRLAEEQGRTLTLPTTTNATDTQLPAPVAGRVIGWDDTATGLRNIDPATLASIVAYANRRTLVANGGASSYTLAADPGNASNTMVAVSGVVQTPGVDYNVSGLVLTPTTPWPAGTGNVVIVYGEALPTGVTDAGLIGVTSSLAGTQPTTQYEVNERARNVFDWLTPTERAAVTNRTVLDITTNVQAAIDSGKSLYFPQGTYYVKKLTFSGVGLSYWFNTAQINAIDTAPQKGVIDWKASFCKVYGLTVTGNWRSNYDAAIYWHSESPALPSKSNHFFDLAIDNAVRGIVFGELSPASVVDAPQSENYVYGFRSRGVERVLYVNQPNGFLDMSGEFLASKNEWDIVNPSAYSFANSIVADVLQGVVRLQGEFIKVDTQLGVGLRTSGGVLDVSGHFEIACQVFSGAGGFTSIHDISFAYWGNASTSWAVLTGTSGVLTVDNLVLNKNAGASGAYTAFIEFGTATGWDVRITNARLENQNSLVFSNGSAQPHMWAGDNKLVLDNVASVPAGGGSAPTFPAASTSLDNLLDLRGTDTRGNDIATWYKSDVTGVGAIALNADIPSGTNYFNSIQVTPAVTTGRSRVNSLDATSLASCKATGIKCRPGETYLLSGWFRMTTSGTAGVDVLYANAAGSIQVGVQVITQTQLLTNAWRYLSVMFVVPASCAYMGIGMDCSAGTVGRMVGLRVARLGNEP